jgi:hypothetical protein
MSIYNPPSQDLPIFNPIYWDTSANSSDDYLTSAEASSTYAKLAGNQTIIGFETFSGGVKTETLQSITPGNSINVSESVNLASAKSYKINNTDVLSATSLGSSVVSSSLTSVGTQTGGINIATGQTYKVNNVAVLSATSLGSSVVSSSLTSIGTLASGCNLASGQTYKVNSTEVLSATTLGSTVLQSSLVTIGKLQAGCNISSGQTYKVENTAVLSATALGSTVVSSSLTSIGTLASGCNIATGQTYKVNNVGVLSATALGSTVVDSALKSIGTLETTTVYYQRTVSGSSTTQTVTANNIIIQLQTSAQRYLQHQSYSITFPSGTSAFAFDFARTTGFVQYSVRNQNYTYYANGFITLLGTTVNPVGTSQKSSNINTPTLSISTISGSALPAINISLSTALSALTNNVFTITMYYQTE